MLLSIHPQVIGATVPGGPDGIFVSWAMLISGIGLLVTGNWAIFTFLNRNSDKRQDAAIAALEKNQTESKQAAARETGELHQEMNRRLAAMAEKNEKARDAREDLRERVHQIELTRERDRRHTAETYATKTDMNAGFAEMKGLIRELQLHIDQRFDQVTSRAGGQHAG